MKDNRISSKMTKRNWLQTGARLAAALALAVPTWAQAQGAYPNRPIKIVVPYSAGTGSDVLARTIYGFRISVLFGLILTIFSSIFGITAGAIQGYFGGKIDLFFQNY
jgi:ABC-type microcin C transport system permease subunit YejE